MSPILRGIIVVVLAFTVGFFTGSIVSGSASKVDKAVEVKTAKAFMEALPKPAKAQPIVVEVKAPDPDPALKVIAEAIVAAKSTPSIEKCECPSPKVETRVETRVRTRVIRVVVPKSKKQFAKPPAGFVMNWSGA